MIDFLSARHGLIALAVIDWMLAALFVFLGDKLRVMPFGRLVGYVAILFAAVGIPAIQLAIYTPEPNRLYAKILVRFILIELVILITILFLSLAIQRRRMG
jgi:hypothetical protein